MKSTIRLLFVDDEESYRNAFLRAMRKEKQFLVETAANGREALQVLKVAKADIIITDMQMPEMDGIALLRAVRDVYPDIFAIVVTGQASIENAVLAMKLGAYDYLLKPFDMDVIKIVLKKIVEHRSAIQGAADIPADRRAQYRFENIIGQDRKMYNIYEMINAVAKTLASVLITGESGCGKELIAEAIHFRSDRRLKPFHRVNCAAFTESIIHSELFGHEKGAFTGADQQKTGFFEAANEGTLFLDEIGDIPPQTQISLLRVLETGAFQRVGGTRTIQVDTRLVCATNKDLGGAMQRKQFREDLYYRINVVHISVPPLRERKVDIPLLAAYFLEKYGREEEKNIKRISRSAMKILNQYNWPGNVRELANIIKHALIFCKSREILPANLPENLKEGARTKKFRLTLDSPSLPEAEARIIREVLETNGWNLKKAAEELAIARGTLYGKMKKYDIQKSEAY